MTKRRIMAALVAAFVLVGCDTTGSAPTSLPGFSDPPTAGAATTQQPGQQISGTTYPLVDVGPTIAPNPVNTYPTANPANQTPANANQAYPTPTQ